MSGSRAADPSDFARALVRFNSHVLGVSFGLMASGGLLVATLLLVWRGGEQAGAMLGQLRYFFPGYSVSVSGAFVGALWAGAAGYVSGALFSRAYGPWLLREAVRAATTPGEEDAPGGDVAFLSPLPMAMTTGALLALVLFAGTLWLLRHGPYSPHLELLKHYLPGFGTDVAGAAIGADWVFLYGLVAAGGAAWIYNRVAAMRRAR